MAETKSSTTQSKKPSRMAQPSVAHLPPLFTQPEVVNPAAHGGLYFTPLANDDAARQTHALPLIVQEVTEAAADGPVLFVKENEHWGVIALTGIRAGEGYRVDNAGHWRGYRPLYLNLYPFIAGTPTLGEPMLCIDRACDGLSEECHPGARALFTQDGRPEAWLVQIQADVARYRQAAVASTEALDRLALLGLLQAATARLQVPDAGEQVLDGFYVVDRAAVNALPAETLVGLRDEGLLEVIYAHLVSLRHLTALAEQAAKRRAGEPEEKVTPPQRIEGKKIKQS